MGYSYSTQQNSTELQSSSQQRQSEHIYVLFINNTVRTYHNDFEVCYKEARRLCKNITFDLMMTHGSSNYVSFEEEKREDGSCNIIIYCTPKNMLGNIIRQIDSVILIKKIEKLNPTEEEYTTKKYVENMTEENEDDNESENESSEQDEEGDNKDEEEVEENEVSEEKTE
jgi:hypothetical protein